LFHAGGQTDVQKGMTKMIIPHWNVANATKIYFAARMWKIVRQHGLVLRVIRSSVAKQMITVLFWAIKQSTRIVVITYRRFGQPMDPIFKAQEHKQIMGPHRLSRNFGKELLFLAA
jgi:hypothetical protein